MEKNGLNRIFLLIAAGVLLLLGAVGVVRALQTDGSGLVWVSRMDPEVVSVETPDLTPTASPVPIRYENTVTLLVDRAPVMTFSSELAAKQILWEYLAASAVAPEGERFVSAAFDCELILVSADSLEPPVEADEALYALQADPALVPIRLVTVKTEISEAAPELTQTVASALSKGTRIVTQLGAGARSETSVELTYRAGAIVETGTPVTAELREARATILRVGTMTREDTTGEAARDEGPMGKDKGDLALTYPMRGTITCYFGFRDGAMQNGIDLSAAAGTAVTAPGEGIVVYCGERGAYGFVVDIDHGNGFVSRLTHLSDVTVELNQRVFAGDAIGVLAAAEDGGKPCLRYELIIDGVPYNPLYYIG